MKRINQWLVMLVAVAVLGCAGVGCKTSPRVFKGTAEIVYEAMKGWGDWVKAGHASPEQIDQVGKAYVRYQLAMHVAYDGIKVTMTDTNSAVNIKTSVAVATASWNDLLALITSFKANPVK